MAGYAGGFVATYFFGIPKEKLAAEKMAEEPTTAVSPVQTTPVSEVAATTEFFAVANGEVKPVSESTDAVFSQKMMGEGYFVVPKEGTIYAPVTGTISSVFPTKHAVGITTDNGLEVLLHMGVNTVELEGKPFDLKVAEGQKVTPDTIVADVDLAAIKAAGKGTDMLVLVTNMDKVKNEVLEKIGATEAKTPVMKVEV